MRQFSSLSGPVWGGCCQTSRNSSDGVSASCSRNPGLEALDCPKAPRTLILGDRRIAVADVVDAWLAPDYRYFKLRGADGATYLVRHDEHANTWELTMFRAEHVDG